MNSVMKVTRSFYVVFSVFFLVFALGWFVYNNQYVFQTGPVVNENSNAGYFQTHVINPVLVNLNLYSRAASNLLLGTAIQESFLGKLSSNEFQIETATAADVIKNYLPAHPALQKAVNGLYDTNHTLAWNLSNNVKYEIAMARVIYLRTNQPLPVSSDVAGMGQFWKKNYNTVLGKGTASEFKMHFISFATDTQQNNNTASDQNVAQNDSDSSWGKQNLFHL